MLGSSAYARNPLDFYPTPRPALDGFLAHYEDDVPAFQFWEPFAGNGAIYNPVSELARHSLATDINAYEGFDCDALVDFFSIFPDGDDDRYDAALVAYERAVAEGHTELPARPRFMSEVESIKGFRPDAIITNPPYGKLAAKAALHSIRLMEQEMGIVAFLCRHEWDAAAGRRHLFDHPAFSAKVVLRHRPRWIAGSKGAPRHSYAWYVWDWTKARSAPNVPPELLYAR